MSFDDLPDNWSDLPLDTPGLAADVADLVVGHRDRLAGCIGLVITRPDLTMSRPAVINDVDDTLLTDSDRRWHQMAIDACRVGRVPLVGAFLATPAVVRSFPAPFDATADSLAS